METMFPLQTLVKLHTRLLLAPIAVMSGEGQKTGMSGVSIQR